MENDIQAPEQITSVQADGLNILFHPNFYNLSRSNEIFEQLKNIQFNGDWKNIPRKQIAFGNSNLSYKFSGNEINADEWPVFLREIRDELRQYLIDDNILAPTTSQQINYVLLTLYRDGNDYIGPHSDDEKDLEIFYDAHGRGESIIISLSFGATRDFIFHNKSKSTIKYELPLQHGDLVIMRGDTQKKWRHSLPKRLKVKTPRINLTFRFMKEKKPISP